MKTRHSHDIGPLQCMEEYSCLIDQFIINKFKNKAVIWICLKHILSLGRWILGARRAWRSFTCPGSWDGGVQQRAGSRAGWVLWFQPPSLQPPLRQQVMAQLRPSQLPQETQNKLTVMFITLWIHIYFLFVWGWWRLAPFTTPQSAAQEGAAKRTTSKPQQLSSVHKNLLFAQSKVARAASISVLSWEEISKKCQWCKEEWGSQCNTFPGKVRHFPEMSVLNKC